MIADAALSSGADVQKILAAPVGSRTMADAITETVAKVGEHMTLRRAAGLSVSKGVVASYVHNAVSDGLGRIGVIVTLDSAGKEDELKAFGRMVAMHIASANPQAVDSAGLEAAAIEREKNVLADKAKAQGKPANVVEKIVESGLKTYYKEVCLLDQPFIFDDKKSVGQALKESEARAGGPIKIGGFVRYALGEGIDRPDGDFSGEVAALAGAH
jgi:elongation factor Ts